ncbi:MAG: hypothetical protein ACYCSO_09855 [Cuniculiplasma sp.]
MVSSIFDRHKSSILLFLLEYGSVNKSKLISIVTSPPVLTNVINKMEEEKLIKTVEERIGRRTINISLTDRGLAVAEQLRRAEDISKGRKFLFPDKFAIISFLDKTETSTMTSLTNEFRNVSELLKELEDLKVIKQEINSSGYPPTNSISLTEKGKRIADKLNEIEELFKE